MSGTVGGCPSADTAPRRFAAYERGRPSCVHAVLRWNTLVDLLRTDGIRPGDRLGRWRRAPPARIGIDSRPAHFDANFRSTVFDNRGIGQTRCERSAAVAARRLRQRRRRTGQGGVRRPGRVRRIVARLSHHPGGRHRPSRDRPLRGRDGHRRVEHRVGMGLPGGRDRVSPGRRITRRNDGGLALRTDVLSSPRAR